MIIRAEKPTSIAIIVPGVQPHDLVLVEAGVWAPQDPIVRWMVKVPASVAFHLVLISFLEREIGVPSCLNLICVLGFFYCSGSRIVFLFEGKIYLQIPTVLGASVFLEGGMMVQSIYSHPHMATHPPTRIPPHTHMHILLYHTMECIPASGFFSSLVCWAFPPFVNSNPWYFFLHTAKKTLLFPEVFSVINWAKILIFFKASTVSVSICARFFVSYYKSVIFVYQGFEVYQEGFPPTYRPKKNTLHWTGTWAGVFHAPGYRVHHSSSSGWHCAWFLRYFFLSLRLDFNEI